MHYSSKTTLLDDDELSNLEIPKGSRGYRLKFDHIIEERSYDIENQLLAEGYMIHSEKLIQVSINVFNYVVIASK